MPKHFHRNLNRMALFTALIAVGVIMFWRDFMTIASSNIILNGIIIGTALFGIIICFIDMFQLRPEYRWVHQLTQNDPNPRMAPRLMRPVAIILRARPLDLSTRTLDGLLDMITLRFDDQREPIRYVTNTLIFLGLLGTFWGLILTVGGFANLIGVLNFEDESVMTAMQTGLAGPLGGMATAFTSSLLGLGASLIVGFLGLQVELAQNAIFRELQDFLSAHTRVMDAENVDTLGAAAHSLGDAVRDLERALATIKRSAQ